MLFVYGIYVFSVLIVVCLFKRGTLEYKKKSKILNYLFIAFLALFPVGNSVICAYVLYHKATRNKRQLQHG